MIRTLIKHEYLRTRGDLGTVLGILILLALGGSAMTALRWPLISVVGQSLVVLGTFSPVPAAQLTLALDYWRSAYRPGYLTHSLPVRGATQYWVRLGWGFVVSIGGAALTLGLAALLLPLQLDLALLALLPVWLQIALPLLCLMLPLIHLYFAASIGSERRLNGLGAGGPIVVWVLTYLGMQALAFVGILAIPAGLDTYHGARLVQSSVLDAMVNNTPVRAMPLGWVVSFVLATVALPWRTAVSWNSKTSLN